MSEINCADLINAILHVIAGGCTKKACGHIKEFISSSPYNTLYDGVLDAEKGTEF